MKATAEKTTKPGTLTKAGKPATVRTSGTKGTPAEADRGGHTTQTKY